MMMYLRFLKILRFSSWVLFIRMTSRDSGVMRSTSTGSLMNLFLALPETSPCHFIASRLKWLHQESMRMCMSFIRALRGDT